MDDTLPQAPAPSSIPPQVPAAPATFAQPPQKGPPLVKGEPAFEPISNSAGAVARRIVADDNSCLFSACGYVLQGTRAAAPALRSVVAEAVLSDPFEWNEAVLGKDPIDYAAWIKDPKRWGGAIELSILSKKFGKEIAAFDIQTQRVDIYGQGEGFNERVMVVYDGTHDAALSAHAAALASFLFHYPIIVP